jgi:Flp pilus assembly protein TadG
MSVKLTGRRVLRRFSNLGGDSGQSMVETALGLLLVISSAMAVFEVCMFAYTSSAISEAAHEGLRYALVNGSDTGVSASGCSTSSPSGVISAVGTVATEYNLNNTSAMTVNVCYPGGSTPGSLVTVTVSYPYTPYTPVPGFKQTLTASTQGRILY